MSKVSKVLMMGGRNGRARDDYQNYGESRGRNQIGYWDDQDYDRREHRHEWEDSGYHRDGMSRSYPMRRDGYRSMGEREIGDDYRESRNRHYSGPERDEDEDYYFKVKGRFGPAPMKELHTQKMDKETAQEWAEHMENEDGTKGPHWSMEQVRKAVEQHKELQAFELPDVFAVINMMYSDYVEVAKKFNVNNIDFYVCMTKAWLEDKDTAAGKAKTLDYYKYIVL